jgi:hypothetical protein
MSEKKTLLPEELKSIHGFRKGFQQITFDLGNVELQMAALLERKDSLLESVKNLRKEEDEYLVVLEEKYGGGKIDLETGEITPLEDEAPQETSSASNL